MSTATAERDPRAASPARREKSWEVEVFYDGECPLCRREIDMLRRKDRRRRIRFTDIASADFDGDAVGRDYDTLMAQIHGRLPDGQWIVGVEVFRRLYSAVGFGWLVRITRVPGISHLLSLGYRWFAKRRLSWTGRDRDSCGDGRCRAPVADSES